MVLYPNRVGCMAQESHMDPTGHCVLWEVARQPDAVVQHCAAQEGISLCPSFCQPLWMMGVTLPLSCPQLVSFDPTELGQRFLLAL